MSLLEDIQNYIPYNEQEETDRLEILRQLQNGNVWDRSNTNAHLTASAWVVNETKQKVLLCYHNLYQSWSWLGGHADGERNLLEVAMREVREESGVLHVRPVNPSIFSLEVLTVDGHEKHGKYVSSHLHLNVTYLLEVSEHEMLKNKPDENAAVQWFPIEKAVEASSEEWFKKRIYSKLNKKMIETYLRREKQ